MAIFYDPTEGRVSTAIPKIDNYGKPMPGLERATACDIAIFENHYQIQDNFLSHPKSEEVARLSRQGIGDKEIISHVDGISVPIIKKIIKVMARPNRAKPAIIRNGFCLGTFGWDDMVCLL